MGLVEKFGTLKYQARSLVNGRLCFFVFFFLPGRPKHAKFIKGLFEMEKKEKDKEIGKT